MVKEPQNQDKLRHIENKIQALQRMKLELRRLFAIWKAQRFLSEESAREIINLWRLKLELGLPLRPIVGEKKRLERDFSKEIVDHLDMELEVTIPVFLPQPNGEIAISDKLDSCLAEIDTLLKEMEKIRATLKRQKKPTRQCTWNVAHRFLKVALGSVLIAIDTPTINWLSIIPGAITILSAIQLPLRQSS